MTLVTLVTLDARDAMANGDPLPPMMAPRVGSKRWRVGRVPVACKLQGGKEL